MESNTRALETVCKYFQSECGNREIQSLRKRNNRAHVANSRLRQKCNCLEQLLKESRDSGMLLNRILHLLIQRMDSMLEQRRGQIVDE